MSCYYVKREVKKDLHIILPLGIIKSLLKMTVKEERKETIRNENWQGKLFRARWADKVE